VRAAAKLNVAHVLPGHGGPGGKEVLSGQEQFFIELTKAVKAEIAQNKKLEDILKKEGPKVVSMSIQLPDSVKSWVGDMLANQVKNTYEELTLGKPSGEILGGK